MKWLSSTLVSQIQIHFFNRFATILPTCVWRSIRTTRASPRTWRRGSSAFRWFTQSGFILVSGFTQTLLSLFIGEEVGVQLSLHFFFCNKTLIQLNSIKSIFNNLKNSEAITGQDRCAPANRFSNVVDIALICQWSSFCIEKLNFCFLSFFVRRLKMKNHSSF
jgi:hypothetical protein